MELLSKKQKRLSLIKSKEGKILLNLACGTKVHQEWNNIDFSLYAKLAHHISISKILNILGIISNERYKNLLNLSKTNIICYDLRLGIPFNDNTVDFAYSSHFIEHLDKK